jgi:drug/metabolite transporter (DMT)-like permease
MASRPGDGHGVGMATPHRPDPAGIRPADIASLIALGALWGGAYLFSRVAAPEVGPLWVGVARVGLAAIVLLAVTGPATLASVRARPRAFLVVALTSSAIPFTLIAFSAMTLPTALGGLLNATTPMFTALIAAVWLGLRLTARTMVGLAVGLVAVMVLLGWSPVAIGPAVILAAIASLAAAANFGFAGVYARRTLADIPPLTLAAGQMTVATLVLLPLAVADGIPPVPSTAATAALVALGVGSTALAWPLYFRVLRGTTATAASTVTFIIPGFAILWGAIALGEPLGPGTAVGFGLVLVSLILVLGLRVTRPRLPVRRPRALAVAAEA